jgi:hypothetical protein
VIAAGNYDTALHAHGENAEMNRQSIKSNGLWYVHSGVHIKTFLKHHGGPGGLNMYFAERKLTNDGALKELHRYVFRKWGPLYINSPDKSRMMCKWRQMYHDFVGPKCAAAVKDFTLYEAKDVKPARRMFA